MEEFKPKYNERKFFIQKKGLIFWHDLGDYGEYGCCRFNFDSAEEALAFLHSGLRNPSDPIIKVVQYVNS
jgi:hypothetical protein